MNKQIARLQYITHPTAELSPAQQAELVLQGGGNWIQLRMKKHSAEAILEEAKKIKALKSTYNFTFILNDHPELALDCKADGVHLGKQDCSPAEARKLLGDHFIIGGTANTIDDIERLAGEGVDYIGLGPFRFTSTKENLSPILGIGGYTRLMAEMKARGINLPVVGIGGVLLPDIGALMQTGLHGLATSSAIRDTASIPASTREWLESIAYATKQTIEKKSI